MATLPGRAREQRWLSDRAVARWSGRQGPGLLLVTGEAGVGKTRLVRDSIDAVLVRAAIAYHAAETTAPGAGVRAVAGAGAAATARTREDVFAAAAGALERSPGGAVLLDDLQWADDLTLEWLAQVAATLAATSTVVVATVRVVDELPERIAALVEDLRRTAAVERLHLRPLDREAVREFATSLVGPLDDAGVDRVWRLTDGLPLFVEEVLNRSTPVGDVAESRHSLLLRVVTDDLAALGPLAAEVTAVAAVAPEPLDHALLADVVGEPVEDALRSVLAVGLLVADSRGGSRFRHELVRGCVYASIPPESRRALHAAIADHLAAQPACVPRTVAAHYDAAGDPVRALTWHKRAALHALELSDAVLALDACVAALALAAVHDRASLPELVDETTTAARLCGQVARALDAVDSIGADALPPVARGAILLARARLVAYVGDSAGRFRELTAARAAFTEGGDARGAARALAEMAFPSGPEIPFAERIAYGRAAIREARLAGDLEVTAIAHGNTASAMTRLGLPGGLDHYERSIGALRRCEPFSAAQIRLRMFYNYAICLLDVGHYADAARVLAEARVAVTDPGGPARYDLCRALLQWRTGSWDEALEHVARARAAGSQPGIEFLPVIEGSISAERDRVPRTADLAAAAAEEVSRRDEWAPSAVAALFAVKTLRNEPVPRRYFDTIATYLLESQTRYAWEDALRAQALTDWRMLQRFVGRLGDLRPAGRRAEATLTMVSGLDPARDPAERVTLLSEAAEAFAALPEPFVRAQCLDRAADAALAAGHRPGALRREAAEVYDAIGAHASLARLLRRSHGSRAMTGFSVPAAHRHRAALGLTDRERDVARLAAQGYTAREIAVRLGVAESTVRTHVENAKRKLGVPRMRDLARALTDEG